MKSTLNKYLSGKMEERQRYKGTLIIPDNLQAESFVNIKQKIHQLAPEAVRKPANSTSKPSQRCAPSLELLFCRLQVDYDHKRAVFLQHVH